MPALISWVNWLDRSSSAITASSQASNLAPTRLAEPQLRARWRTAAGVVTPQLDVDFGAQREVGVIALAQPDDAGGINVDGEARGTMAATDRVWHTLDDGAAGLTNLLIGPEAFANAAWIRTTTAVATGAIISPDPARLADQLTLNNSASSSVTQTVTVAASTASYRYDIWLRAGTATTVIIRLRIGTTVRVSGLLVDLAAGTFTTAPGGNYAPENASMVDYGNGWWRVGLSIPNNSQTVVRADIVTASASVTTLFVWGAQLVVSSTPMGYRGVGSTAGINSAGVGSGYDSGNIVGGWRAGYGMQVSQPPSAVMSRYWRCRLNAASLSSVPGFIDLGRAWVGPAWTPSRGNISYGFGETWTDGSQVERNPRSGLEFIDLGPRSRVLNFGFAELTESDTSQIRELQRIAGMNRQILFVPFPGAGSEKAAPIIGRLTEVQPITMKSFQRYAVTFQVRQST